MERIYYIEISVYKQVVHSLLTLYNQELPQTHRIYTNLIYLADKVGNIFMPRYAQQRTCNSDMTLRYIFIKVFQSLDSLGCILNSSRTTSVSCGVISTPGTACNALNIRSTSKSCVKTCLAMSFLRQFTYASYRYSFVSVHAVTKSFQPVLPYSGDKRLSARAVFPLYQ